jgi:beta-glucuronidase
LVARIAEEEGILLQAEITVYWAIDFANPLTMADACNQLAELIARGINRASVIIWGVGNENADMDARLAFMLLVLPLGFSMISEQSDAKQASNMALIAKG